ncbi:MAG TPA: hypothetical protein VIY49_26840 [Bryobacteraceae bacterium]
MVRLGAFTRAFTGPLILLAIVTGFFWKLLTTQYTWLDEPDAAYQVLPWMQFEAASWHRSEMPLWDPHEWGGQPLAGQLQPGAAYPPNWLLFLLPLKDGHIRQGSMHAYFIFTHFLAALFCYWLCRDLRLSLAASILGGLVFSLSGVIGNLGWPQVLNGAIWIPLVVMFCLRSIRGQRPVASAALAGTFLGISFLSGHHQFPIMTTLLATGFWLYELARSRMRAWKPIAAFVLFTAFTGAFQILPAYEYGSRAIRFIGLPYGVYWGQSVPYSVHEQFSLLPSRILGLALPNLGGNDAFVGLAALILALLGLAANLDSRDVRLLGATVAGGLLFALGSFSVFHGVAYLAIPMVDKASMPQMAMAIAQFGIAALAAYGLEALRKGVRLGRWWIPALIVTGALPWPALALAATVRAEASREYERLAILGLVALALAAILQCWKSQRLKIPTVSVLLIALTVFEIGTVTGDNYRDRDHPGGFLAELSKDRDAIEFLRSQPDFERLEVDVPAVPANLGDWEGIDAMQTYLGGLTSNVAQLASIPVEQSQLLVKLFSLTHYLGPKPIRDDQQEIFHGASGINVYRNPAAFPRVFAVHQIASVNRRDLIPRLEHIDLRAQAFVTGPAPILEQCGGDRVQVIERRTSSLALEANMACQGMVILSETFFPGWEATVDSRRVPIYEIDGALRGVVAGAGVHRIEMRYRPTSVLAGGIMTLAGLLGAVIAMAAGIGMMKDSHGSRQIAARAGERFS